MDLQSLKLTALVNGISLWKIPLLAFITPKVLVCSKNQAIIKVPLDWRTRNHLGVMYFGALAMGAELSIALKAVEKIQESGERIDFLFKDFHAQFLKRADNDVHFICDQADAVAALIEEALQKPERFEKTFSGSAFVPKSSPEPVMTYQLTLSVRHRPRK